MSQGTWAGMSCPWNWMSNEALAALALKALMYVKTAMPVWSHRENLITLQVWYPFFKQGEKIDSLSQRVPFTHKKNYIQVKTKRKKKWISQPLIQASSLQEFPLLIMQLPPYWGFAEGRKMLGGSQLSCCWWPLLVHSSADWHPSINSGQA